MDFVERFPQLKEVTIIRKDDGSLVYLKDTSAQPPCLDGRGRYLETGAKPQAAAPGSGLSRSASRYRPSHRTASYRVLRSGSGRSDRGSANERSSTAKCGRSRCEYGRCLRTYLA